VDDQIDLKVVWAQSFASVIRKVREKQRTDLVKSYILRSEVLTV